MEAKEFRNKTDKELQDELLALHKEQFNLRMQRATGQMARPHDFSRIRKDIARIKTVQSERAKTGDA